MSLLKDACVSLWIWLELASKNTSLGVFLFTFLNFVLSFLDVPMPFIKARGGKKRNANKTRVSTKIRMKAGILMGWGGGTSV